MVFFAFFDIVFADDDLFDFVKLVDAVQAACVFSRCPSLATETGTQGHGLDRQLFLVEDFT
jgi:hypothetical protein